MTDFVADVDAHSMNMFSTELLNACLLRQIVKSMDWLNIAFVELENVFLSQLF